MRGLINLSPKVGSDISIRFGSIVVPHPAAMTRHIIKGVHKGMNTLYRSRGSSVNVFVVSWSPGYHQQGLVGQVGEGHGGGSEDAA